MTIVEGKKSVDVEVELCYCNEDLCNTELSGSLSHHQSAVIILITFITMTWILK